jgi:hypothetical protein
VLPASLAASLLTVAGAAVAAQVISARLGHPVLHPEITVRFLHTLTWSDPELMAAGGGLMLAGLSLVLAAVLPGRTGTAALAGDDPRFITGLVRSSLRADLRSTVLGVAGVDTATVRLRGFPQSGKPRRAGGRRRTRPAGGPGSRTGPRGRGARRLP